GLESWVQLGEAVGLDRRELESLDQVLPAVRFAVDTYGNFVRQAPWPWGVCSVLTELFSPTAHGDRLDYFPQFYPWVEEKGLHYFRQRLVQSPVDVEVALEVTTKYFKTRKQQDLAGRILQFKLDVL